MTPLIDAGAERDGPISRRLTFLLHRLVAVLVEISAKEFREDGLSIPAARTLVCLFESGGATTVGNLSEATSIDLSTTSHILRRLEHQGLVTRERQVDDNRIVVARLTSQGADVAARCRGASLRHEAMLIQGMPPHEVAMLKRLLEQAFANARSVTGDSRT